MKNFKKILSILSPYDVVVAQISTREIVKKNASADLTGVLFPKADKILSAGPHPERNPSYYSIASGKNKLEIQDWQDRVIEELKSSPDHRVNVTDLDNNSNVVEVISTIRLSTVNCFSLTDEDFKEFTCVKIYTPYGQLKIET